MSMRTARLCATYLLMADNAFNLVQLDALAREETVLHRQNDFASYKDGSADFGSTQSIVRHYHRAVYGVLLWHEAERDLRGDGFKDSCDRMSV